MKPLLAILIPTLTKRAKLLNRLTAELDKQRANKNVILILNPDEGQKTTGQKRNELIHAAIENKADYFAFFDDDDMPGPNYIKLGIETMESGLDCGELWGHYYDKGKFIKPFHHYLGCTHAWEDEKKYHRFPNHLNFWRLDLVKDFSFQNKTFGEDMTWAEAIHKVGVVKTMHPISDILYHYYK